MNKNTVLVLSLVITIIVLGLVMNTVYDEMTTQYHEEYTAYCQERNATLRYDYGGNAGPSCVYPNGTRIPIGAELRGGSAVTVTVVGR